MPWCESVHDEYQLGAEYRADFVLLGALPNADAIEDTI